MEVSLPITKSAKKSLKVSRTKKAHNDKAKIQLSKALKKTDAGNVSQTISVIDKSAKRGLIHPNKAARMKSRLAKKFGTAKVLKAKSANVKATAKKSTAKTTKTKTTKKAAIK